MYPNFLRFLVVKLHVGILLLTASIALPSRAQPAEGGGIGVALGVEEHNVVIKRILTNTPASHCQDLHVGDRILAIAQANETPVRIEKDQIAKAVRLMRGPQGAPVRLTLVTQGEEDSKARTVLIVRGEISALSAWGDGRLLAIGTVAPDIELTLLPNNTKEKLSDYKGKFVLLEFWATWCEPCHRKIAELQTCCQQHPEWSNSLIPITASVDADPAAALKLLQAKAWARTHNVWVRPEAKVAYHLDGIPTAYLIDQEGKIVAANPNDLVGAVARELQKQP